MRFFRVLMTITASFSLVPLFAQSVFWAKRFGGPNVEEVRSLLSDQTGNVYVLGSFSGTAQFDPDSDHFPLTSKGKLLFGINGFLSKFDSSGKLLWVKQLKGTGTGSGSRGTVDKHGNLYIIGWFKGTVDFDGNKGKHVLKTPSDASHLFILKLNSDGDFQWVRQVKGTGDMNPWAITLDPAGQLYISGNYSGSYQADQKDHPLDLLPTGSYMFIGKLDASGQFTWIKTYAGSENSGSVNSICCDAQGNLYITGYFGGSIKFGPEAHPNLLTSSGKEDIFLAKLSPDADVIWLRRIGGPERDEAQSIRADSLGAVYVAGNFNGAVRIDLKPDSVFTLHAHQYGSYFVCKLDSLGRYVWLKPYGTLTGAYLFDMDLDPEGHIWTSSSLKGAIDGSLLPLNINFLKSDAARTTIDIKQILNIGYAVFCFDDWNHLVVAGQFTGEKQFYTVDGPLNLRSTGVAPDLFIVKYRSP